MTRIALGGMRRFLALMDDKRDGALNAAALGAKKVRARNQVQQGVSSPRTITNSKAVAGGPNWL